MNPFLERLGYSPEDKVIIFHADDLGMCHAANQGFFDIVESGVLRSGSIMVPCPWFPEMAAFARECEVQLDLGVHLTLTSEWEGYRWRPLATQDPHSGLIDQEGYFWRDIASLYKHMDPVAVALELRAQVERAVEAGVDVTHLDTHMAALVHPDLAPVYLALAQEFHAPALIPRLSVEQAVEMGVEADMAAQMIDFLASLEQTGMLPLLDHAAQLYAIPRKDRWQEYVELIADFPRGITHLAYHPARAGAEIEGIAAKDWRIRTCDEEVFSRKNLSSLVKGLGVDIFEYRMLRDLMRSD
jgi:predicted glycoside hydrolase/deacetylase ChbG (UPF0249 family)